MPYMQTTLKEVSTDHRYLRCVDNFNRGKAAEFKTGCSFMRIKAIIDEDYTNYKKPAMFIGTASCCGKCCKEAGLPLSVCQNDEMAFTLSFHPSR